MKQVDPKTLEYAKEHGVVVNRAGIPRLHIRPSQYGGLGNFANTDIKQGQNLLREDSVLVLTQHLDSEGYVEIDKAELSTQYAKLSTATQAEVMRLAALQSQQSDLAKLKSIASVNNYAAEIDDIWQKC